MEFEEYDRKMEFCKNKFKRLRRENTLAKSLPSSIERRMRKKERDHQLILRGSLFEIVGLLPEAPESLLGFLMENMETYYINRNRYFETGSHELKRREEIRIKIKKEMIKDRMAVGDVPSVDVEARMINNDEINQLLIISLDLNERGIDISTIMQKKFKKRLFDELTLGEFLFFRALSE